MMINIVWARFIEKIPVAQNDVYLRVIWACIASSYPILSHPRVLSVCPKRTCTYTLLEPVGRPRPPIPSRCSPFPPREQLLAAAVRGAVVVVVAVIIIVVVVVMLL